MMNRRVPVSTDSVIRLVLSNVNQFRVIQKTLNHIHCSVIGIVIHHNHIVRETCFLVQCRFNSIANGFYPVFTRNNNRRFELKLIICKLDVFEFRFQISAYIFQVLCTSLFHLDLNGTVFWVHIVENLFTCFSGIVFNFVIKEFVDMHQFAFL
ncbi:MAG: hypothetical protein BWZ00_01760 [Bacteroidetes bacterium ADurb.BinA174]|nr:MAG: hypothetical protein BWZ00_01760 [Bacteroidetes bacterium ADurb.BinA174]